MSEMIETCIDAIAEHSRGVAVPARSDSVRATWARDALAVIEALRKPTEAMIVAGDEAIIEALNEHPADPTFANGTPAERCWLAMIEAARARSTTKEGA